MIIIKEHTWNMYSTKKYKITCRSFIFKMIQNSPPSLCRAKLFKYLTFFHIYAHILLLYLMSSVGYSVEKSQDEEETGVFKLSAASVCYSCYSRGVTGHVVSSAPQFSNTSCRGQCLGTTLIWVFTVLQTGFINCLSVCPDDVTPLTILINPLMTEYTYSRKHNNDNK